MSDHDILASNAVALKRQVEQYIESHRPIGGTKALELVTRLIMVVDRFPLGFEELPEAPSRCEDRPRKGRGG